MLIVETGDGIDNADSYVSLAEADEYFASFGNEDWTGTNAEKEIALRKATRDIDLIYGPVYRGLLFTKTQNLLFPRSRAGVPIGLKRAVFELAFLELDGSYSPTGPATGENAISEETNQFGDLKFTVKYSQPRPDVPELERVRLMLSGLIALNQSTMFGARLVRG